MRSLYNFYAASSQLISNSLDCGAQMLFALLILFASAMAQMQSIYFQGLHALNLLANALLVF